MEMGGAAVHPHSVPVWSVFTQDMEVELESFVYFSDLMLYFSSSFAEENCVVVVTMVTLIELFFVFIYFYCSVIFGSLIFGCLS